MTPEDVAARRAALEAEDSSRAALAVSRRVLR